MKKVMSEVEKKKWVNAVIHNDITKWINAIDNNDIKTIEKMIKEGFDVNMKKEDGWSALHYACYRGRFEIAKLLIDNGANVNIQDIDRRTPLNIAYDLEHTDIIKLLIDNGAKVTLKDKEGDTPLDDLKQQHPKLYEEFMEWLAENHPEKVMELMTSNNIQGERIKKIMAKEEKDKWVNAIKDNDIETIKKMIKEEFDVNIQDKDGWSALHAACFYGHFEIAKLLIDNGADVNIQNKHLIVPLHFSCLNGHFEIAKLLIDSGADVTVKDNHGNTELDILKEKHPEKYEEFMEWLTASHPDKALEHIAHEQIQSGGMGV